MKVIDTVLPEPKTAWEDHKRWLNRMETEYRTAPWVKKIRVDVKDDPETCDHELVDFEVEERQIGLSRGYDPIFKPVKIYTCPDCGSTWQSETWDD